MHGISPGDLFASFQGLSTLVRDFVHELAVSNPGFSLRKSLASLDIGEFVPENGEKVPQVLTLNMSSIHISLISMFVRS